MARDGSLICRRIKRQNLSRNGEGGFGKSRSRKRVAFTSMIFLFHLYLDVVHGKKKKSENSLGVDEFSMAKRKEKTDSTARFPFFFFLFPVVFWANVIFSFRAHSQPNSFVF
ncbi:hypothetical protein OUZ56_027517 [Daphnia magna]|uniref:Transmembrane protein n=1 Tax=Daphnia magna TaxID=35525 RepID=A0ABQ9ZQ00_9CRUS|nr:hypothetical protein OUZ56_027517 [Daphnia magna]